MAARKSTEGSKKKEPPRIFAANLDRLLTEAGRGSGKRLSKATGLSTTQISDLRRDRTSPSIELAGVIALGLGVSLDEFIKPLPGTRSDRLAQLLEAMRGDLPREDRRSGTEQPLPGGHRRSDPPPPS